MTPQEALKRAGHKYPEQIIQDLRLEGFTIVTDYSIEESLDLAYEQGYERGYEDGL